MSIIVVPSVHHTGTKFVYRHLLERLEFVVPSTDTNVVDRERKEIYGKVRIHIDKPLLPRLRVWLGEFPAIVPLRHPRDVAISWKVREKRLDWLAQQWKWLKEEVMPYKPHVLPLDTPQRSVRLAQAIVSLGFPMSTDWRPVCAEGKTVELNDEDEAHVREVMKDGFFEEFGYDY